MIRKYFSIFFDDWRKPIFFWILSVVFVIASLFLRNRILSFIGFLILTLELFVLIISTIYQLSKKRWLKSVITFCLFGGTIFAGILYSLVVFFIDQTTPDTFATTLTIPKNIKIDNPADIDVFDGDKKPDSITNRIVEKIDFQLYNSTEPGIYEYDFWIGKIESGTIYLKAIEISQNRELSAEEVKDNSTVKIYNQTDSIKKFSSKDKIMIYEGDWGDYYAARFEVWFKPDNGAKERKLFSKNYKIEGWMR